jgi:hypothetical protein
VLNVKSGVQTQLVQKGRVGARVWQADDETAAGGARFTITEEKLGGGNEVAVAVSIAQGVEVQVRRYIAEHLPEVGRIVSFAIPSGPGHQSVAGGEHAAALAEQLSNHLRTVKQDNPDAVVHIFAACPNSLLFFLGQHHQSIAPCVVYQFDFDRRGNKSYQPSFVLD